MPSPEPRYRRTRGPRPRWAGAGSVLQAAGTGTPSVAITPLAPTLSLRASGSVTFPGTQPQETVSAPQPLTISNNGNAPLSISSLTFSGSDPGGYFVGSDGCLGEIAPAGKVELVTCKTVFRETEPLGIRQRDSRTAQRRRAITAAMEAERIGDKSPGYGPRG